eukprot:m.87745 g.87745  ORF g.87745 m.87745 type:complete len:734 (+) comp13128_c1_seq3:350-2551(+)
MNRTETTAGVDKIGDYTEITIYWELLGISVTWETACRTYANASGYGSLIVFDSRYPQGAVKTAVPSADSRNGVQSYWPAANDNKFPNALSWAGEFVQAKDSRTFGVSGGPTLFYDNPKAYSTLGPVMGFPMNNFGVASESDTMMDGKTETQWAPGVAGTVTSLPKGFHNSIGLFSSVNKNAGAIETMSSWGEMMQYVYSNTSMEIKSEIAKDITLQKLEYQTDNGAQYCFCKEDCDKKIIDTVRVIEEQGVALGSVSFQGGWWKNPNLHTAHCAPWCVSSWEANSTKIPMGPQSFTNSLKYPLQLYAPYLCMDTPYASQFDLLSSNISLPGCGGSPAYAFKTPTPSTSYEFYKWFMGYGIENWNMTSFETDFMVENHVCVPEFLNDVTALDTWVAGMAKAAEFHKVPMQWCMSSPIHVFMSLQHPQITNFRVSNDYYYGTSWNIGLSSLLVWALGAIPSKDTFWTTDQTDIAIALGGCPGSGCPSDHSSAGCELHTMLALMSTGPVGFSDAFNRTNPILLGRVADTDGVLIKPSRPITTVDAGLSKDLVDGFVLGTYSGSTMKPDSSFFGWYIVAHQIKQTYDVVRADLFPAFSSTTLVWREWHAPCVSDSVASEECASLIHASEPTETLFSISPMNKSEDDVSDDTYAPRLYTIVPVCSNGWVLLGDLTKYVSLSTQLYKTVTCTSKGVSFESLRSTMTTVLSPCSKKEGKFLVKTSRLQAGVHEFNTPAQC